MLARVRNLLEVRLLQKELHEYNNVLEKLVRERTADLQQSFQETIFTLTRAAEYKDVDTGTHVQRISDYSRELAKILDLDEELVDMIFLASPMHDIGKIGIPDHLLLKPCGFTPEEWDIMKGHTVMGAKILGSSKSPYLKIGAEIALNHHERWDGGGYPRGLKGDQIPLVARIFAIADVWDALKSERPYRAAWAEEKVREHIRSLSGTHSGTHFDPQVVDPFMKVLNEI